MQSPAALCDAVALAHASRETTRSHKHLTSSMIAESQLIIALLVDRTQHLDTVLHDMDLHIRRIQAFMSDHGIPPVDLGGDGMVYSNLHGFTVSLF